MPTTTVQRTYANRPSRKRSSSAVDAAPITSVKRARILTESNRPAKPKEKPDQKAQSLIQLHFCVDRPILRSCPLCSLSYTKGVPADERLHSSHCARIQKGMEWGREEEKEKDKAGVTEVSAGVKLKNGSKGRIICFRADVGGKIGSKAAALLETINRTLSAPPLTQEALRECKLYLFLMSHQTKSGTCRNKIVGCVVAQHIETAMAITTPSTPETDKLTAEAMAALVVVDMDMGIFCHPKPLPTPMGIPRLFVASTHRRQGIASKLLTAAAKTFIHGYELDPRRGEIAFTQPTGDGKALMLKWGSGGVRIYDG